MCGSPPQHFENRGFDPMAKKTNSGSQRANRDAGGALSLFIAGCAAECYLLLVHRLFVKGTIDQMLFMLRVVEAMRYVGLALFAAGLVLFLLRGRLPRVRPAVSVWLLAAGVFVAVSAQIMRAVYPAGTTALCILVPVLMLLLAVWLLYQREFALQATSLALLIGCAVLLNRSFSGTIARTVTVLTSLLLVAAAVLLLKLKKADGCLTRGKDALRLLPRETGYSLLLGVLAVCLVGNCAAMLLAGAAYYIIWAASLLLFCLAVYYTVKLM